MPIQYDTIRSMSQDGTRTLHLRNGLRYGNVILRCNHVTNLRTTLMGVAEGRREVGGGPADSARMDGEAGMARAASLSIGKRVK